MPTSLVMGISELEMPAVATPEAAGKYWEAMTHSPPLHSALSGACYSCLGGAEVLEKHSRNGPFDGPSSCFNTASLRRDGPTRHVCLSSIRL